MAVEITITTRQAVLDDSPVAYWPVYEQSGTDCADLSGNGYTMTITGAPTFSVAGPAVGGAPGITFEDNTSYAKRTMAVIGGTSMNADFTMEGWFKTADGNGGELVSQSLASSTGSALHLYIFPTEFVFEAINTAGGAAIYLGTGATDYTDNVWHHVAATWDASETTLRIYVDGVLKGTKIQALDGTLDAMDTTTIGTRWRSGAAYGAGAAATTFADVALFTSCLTGTQILTHYLARGGPLIYPQRGTLSIEQTFGARHFCTFDIVDVLGTGLHPMLDSTVTVMDGATTAFSGFLSGVSEDGLLPQSLVGLKRTVTATDWGGRCDQRLVTKTWAAGDTLEGVLEDLITDYLTVYGITLDPAQATGDTLPALAYENRTVTDVLNDLSARTGWTWKVSTAKVLGMYEVGTVTSPWNITTASDVQRLEWTSSRDKYFNRVSVRYGTQGDADVVDSWVATSSQTSYPLHYNINGYRAVTEDTIYWPVGVYGVDSMRWTYDAATTSLIKNVGSTGGTAVSLNVAISFPQTAVAETTGAAATPWEAFVSVPDVTDYTAASELATAMLAEYSSSAKRVRFETTTAGLAVGQVITITLADRHLSGDHLIVSVVTTHDPDSASLLRYRVEAVAGDYSQGTFLDTYRQWNGLPITTPVDSLTVTGEVGSGGSGAVGLWAGTASSTGAKWRVDTEGEMAAGTYTFPIDAAPQAAVTTAGITTILRGMAGTSEAVSLAWDSTSLFNVSVVSGSTFLFGAGLALDGSTCRGAGTVSCTGGFYEAGSKITTYVPSGANGSFTCDSGAGTYTFNISDGIVSSVTTG